MSGWSNAAHGNVDPDDGFETEVVSLIPHVVEEKKMPRYQTESDVATDALVIAQGACNPRGVSRALTDMIDFYCEQGEGHAGAKDKPALRLVVHQLSFILGIPDMYLAMPELSYVNDEVACQRLVKEGK